MPIIDVEVVGSSEDLPPEIPSLLADVLGEALNARPGATWVRLRHLDRSAYGESGGDVPDDVRPVFVRVLLARQEEAGDIGAMIRRVTDAVADVLDSPADNVHVELAPDGAGRVAFGGKLVE